MTLKSVPPETDLHLPRPAQGEVWDPATIHTYYFGFNIPAERIGVFIYLRFQPTAGMSMGGVCVFRGTEQNVLPLDIEHHDFEIAMPWPTVEGKTIRSANGLTIEFVELGRVVRLSYVSNDGAITFDVVQTGVTPLVGRGQVLPGEAEDRGTQTGAGGSEQFMHCVGELVLGDERFAVDCHAMRDRSWCQVRGQRQGANPSPPVGWSPMWFGDDLCLNQISIETRDTEPRWVGVYDPPADRPDHLYAWMLVDGELRDVVSIRRHVQKYDPRTHSALRQTLEITDETGHVHRFGGEAIASAFLPSWWNLTFYDHVYRWEDDRGRVAHCTYQEVWTAAYQREMNARYRDA